MCYEETKQNQKKNATLFGVSYNCTSGSCNHFVFTCWRCANEWMHTNCQCKTIAINVRATHICISHSASRDSSGKIVESFGFFSTFCSSIFQCIACSFQLNKFVFSFWSRKKHYTRRTHALLLLGGPLKVNRVAISIHWTRILKYFSGAVSPENIFEAFFGDPHSYLFHIWI